eukprot:8886280-Alexandrium_andersonii.AAC.1
MISRASRGRRTASLWSRPCSWQVSATLSARAHSASFRVVDDNQRSKWARLQAMRKARRPCCRCCSACWCVRCTV